MNHNEYNQDDRSENTSYDPQKDGYHPDEIRNAGEVRSQRDSSPPDPDDLSFRAQLKRAPGLLMCLGGAICVVLSLGTGICALIFSFIPLLGLGLNTAAFVLAWAAVALGAEGGIRNIRMMVPRGRLSLFAIAAGMLALLFSMILFCFTGCAACLWCSAL